MRNHQDSAPPHGTILIVDDLPENRKLLASIITRSTAYEVVMAEDGGSALALASKCPPDLVLLDIMMPGMDGLEFARYLRLSGACSQIPIIFITALDSIEDKIAAFESGGVDYITKPFHPREVIMRITTHLELKQHRDHLEDEITRRTREIEQVNGILISTLENANAFSDPTTGNHIRRVAHFSRILAETMQLLPEKVQEIYRYASLHDIGKIGIPHQVLRKPAHLTDDEQNIMREHTIIGHSIINQPGMPETARNVVLHHHERWDGQGYPQGLLGEDIPIEARIVAVADVYDSLRAERPYKTATEEHVVAAMIEEGSGTQFDPAVVKAFSGNREVFDRVFRSFSR